MGRRIREIRKEQNLTLKDVAIMAGLTESLISQIENSKANPSIATLMAVSRVLDVPVGSFFDTKPDSPSPVTRRSERPVAHTANGITYYLLTPHLEDKNLEVLYSEYDKGAGTRDFLRHEGIECGIVLKGKLRVEIEETTYILNDGDSIVIQSTKPHRITNLAEGTTNTIWIDSPPTF
jgi:transcriptional regulator with XRE-family HTH domain